MVRASKIPDRRRYLTDEQVSFLTGRSRSALAKDRFYRRGIPFTKFGRAVRYRLDLVKRYLKSQRIDPQAPRLVG